MGVIHRSWNNIPPPDPRLSTHCNNMKDLLAIALVLIATATADQCEEGRNDPYAMTACQVMAEGRPERGSEKMRQMTSSIDNMGCMMMQRGMDRGEFMQGLIDTLGCVMDTCDAQEDKCVSEDRLNAGRDRMNYAIDMIGMKM